MVIDAKTTITPPMHPTEIQLNRDRKLLTITWEDGTTRHYPAALLRVCARDAKSVGSAVNGWAVLAPSGLTITAVQPIGNYAVHLSFSDGHDRGIYPWTYLIEIDFANQPEAAIGH